VDSSSSSTAAAETPLVKISASDLFLRKQSDEVGEETSPDPPALETSAEERYYLIDKKGITRYSPFFRIQLGPGSKQINGKNYPHEMKWSTKYYALKACHFSRLKALSPSWR
jgi:hypothetical protein